MDWTRLMFQKNNNMKKIIKGVFNAFGLELTKKSKVENAFELQKKIIGNTNKAVTIFDVGAHIGNVSLQYNTLFSNASIYSFEPFPPSFNSLQQNTSTHKNITLFNKGLGAYTGTAKFHSNQSEQTNSILATHEQANSNWGNNDLLKTKEIVEIDLTTIDQIVEEENIKTIDILKMDVQGAEHEVMAGAKKTIEKQMIRLIYTEIITVPTYQGQKEFDDILKMYRAYGFELFTIYKAGHRADGRLQFIDAIFVNPTR